jgi:hypothetical protein
VRSCNNGSGRGAAALLGAVAVFAVAGAVAGLLSALVAAVGADPSAQRTAGVLAAVGSGARALARSAAAWARIASGALGSRCKYSSYVSIARCVLPAASCARAML